MNREIGEIDGEAFKEHRNRLTLTQEELAKKFDDLHSKESKSHPVSLRMIKAIEQGRSKNLQPQILRSFLKVFGLESDAPLRKKTQTHEQENQETLRKMTVGLWSAKGSQKKGPHNKPLHFVFKIEFRLEGSRLRGEFTLVFDSKDGLPNWTYVVDADYRMGRFLQVECQTDNPARLQFSTWILELNDDADKLLGRYVGYGARTKEIVHGELTLQKKQAEPDASADRPRD